MKIFITYGLAFLALLGWVKLTRVGPVIFVVSERYGMGVHKGDFIGFIPLLGVVLWHGLRLRMESQGNS